MITSSCDPLFYYIGAEREQRSLTSSLLIATHAIYRAILCFFFTNLLPSNLNATRRSESNMDIEGLEFIEVNPLSNPKGVKLLCHLCNAPARVQCPSCRYTFYWFVSLLLLLILPNLTTISVSILASSASLKL